jgi:hypothetical protein
MDYAGKSISGGVNSPFRTAAGIHFIVKIAGKPADRD